MNPQEMPAARLVNDYDRIATQIDHALAAFAGNAHEPTEWCLSDSLTMTKNGFITGVIRLQRLRDWCEGLAGSTKNITRQRIAELELELEGADKLEKQQVASARKREDAIDAMRREFNLVLPYVQHIGNCGARGSNAPMDERCVCGLRQVWSRLENLVGTD